MALFQKTVLKEFVAVQNQSLIQDAYAKFQAHFGEPAIQQNIRDAKEEQYQEGFLEDLFVNILGYTLAPQPSYNLITEQKNENNSKKADAAILKEEKIIAVIELKSTKTFDLRNIELQAFSYKNAHQHCRYVVTANFEKLRFYMDNMIEHEEFDLFKLDLERFKVLYTLLHYKNIAKDLPIDLKQKSIQREQDITLAFYNDYEGFREALFKNIVRLNRQYDKLVLFQKTQKLLDRIVFLCFAEDKGLLPSNLVKTMVKEWEDFTESGLKMALYDRFKAYFEFVNKGFKSKKYDIYPYNGGLFAPDEVLDTLTIEDESLQTRSEKLSSYDFDSDIDTNVLGHIFEHSLNELEAKKAELLEEIADEEAGKESRQKSKRKLDGIFYTPLYITNYMIEETLGKLCAEKKKTLQLDFQELDFDKEETKNLVLARITEYETWLSQVRVLDPACGSGAFLNQVLNYFIKEYAWIESIKNGILPPKIEVKKEKKALQTDVFSAPVVLAERKPEERLLTHQILENNIFGVDINFESISITKLSLWLRIAAGKRKLNDLSENIKQGNSLIDDKSIDERAFDWKAEFPKVFAGSSVTLESDTSSRLSLEPAEGFDLIVGNPPYVSTKLIREHQKQYFLEKYATAKGQFDLYGLFIEKGQRLLKKGATLSFITSSTFLSNKDFMDLRHFLFEKTQITQIAYLGETVFDQAAVDVSIIIFKNQKAGEESLIQVFKNRKNFDEDIFHLIRQSRFDLEKNNYEIKLNSEEKDFDLIDKIYENKEFLGSILDLPRGIEIGGNSEKITSKYEIGLEKVLVGKNINRYQVNFEEMYIRFENNKSVFKELEIYKQPKILIQRIRNLTLKQRIVATLDSEGYLCANTLRIGILKNQDYDLSFILGILNSKLVNFIFSKFFLNKDIYAYQLDRVPIPQIDLEKQQLVSEKVNRLLSLNKQFYQSQKDFLELITSNFEKDKFTRKLEKWYQLDWNEFSKELEKSKIKLSLPKQKEWKNFFTEERAKVMPLDDEIQLLEKQLDSLVYQLYNLTSEEIKLVENG